MGNALDKVMNMMLPNLEGNQMANLLGIDNVRKARGRGLLDAGLSMMAMSGPRPATENINPAMIMKMGVDAGTKTYDSAIDKQLKNYQTNLALKTQIDRKESFSKLMDSGLFEKDELEYAKILGATDGADFLSKVYMEKIKKVDKVPSVKKMEIADANGIGTGEYKFVSVKDILDPINADKYLVPTSKGTYAKNISDFEDILNRPLTMDEKTKYINAVMNGNEKNITITTDKNGLTTFSIGGSGSGMEKSTKKDTEKLVIQAYSNFDDFRQVEKLWRPEFNTLPTQMKIGWTKFKNKLGEWNWFSEATDEEKQLVRDFSAWEQKSWEIANSYIKSITGAQMSEREAERILKGFPDPRLGKTDPVAYKTKLDGILKSAQNSIIRYNLLLAKGIDIPKDGNNNLRPDHIMSLMSVDAWVDKIGSELEAELKKDSAYNGMSQDEIEKEVIKQMQVLLGLQRDDKISYTLEDLQ